MNINKSIKKYSAVEGNMCYWKNRLESGIDSADWWACNFKWGVWSQPHWEGAI